MNEKRDLRRKNRREARGFIWYGLQKISPPLGRYSTIISEKTAVMIERGGLHGNSRYFNSADENKYVRLQVVEVTSSYIKIDARLVLEKDALRSPESIGFNALFGSSPQSMIGICATVEEIDDFLDDVWERWVWREDPNAGSKWRKTPAGFKRLSDGKVFSADSVKNSGDGWNTIFTGGNYIVFNDTDLIP